MADAAVDGESAGFVIRVAGLVVILHVARAAISGKVAVIVVDVALRALNLFMQPGQRELSERVVEGCVQPTGR